MSVTDPRQKTKKSVSVKAVFDLLMGVIYAGVGGVLVVSRYIDIKIGFLPPEMIIAFGVLCLIYGGFRIFRGVKTYYTNG